MMSWIAKLIFLRVMGWRIVGDFPKLNKFIIAVVPHTKNLDFVVGVLARAVLGEQINFHPHFGGKIKTLKKYPENPLLAPNHVAGVYKHHGTLKFQSEGLTSLLQGGFGHS